MLTAPRAGDRELGQGTVEWAGVLVVVALVIVALMMASPSLASTISDSMRCSISKILQGSQTGCRGSGATVPSHMTRAEERAEAVRILGMSYREFIAFKHHHPPEDDVYNWSTDGCSSPTPGFLKRLFEDACELHDFGYRNFGHGLELGRNEDMRNEIDNRFLQEMVRTCNDKFGSWYRAANRVSCVDEAGVMYGAVRNGGRKAFYG